MKKLILLLAAVATICSIFYLSSCSDDKSSIPTPDFLKSTIWEGSDSNNDHYTLEFWTSACYITVNNAQDLRFDYTYRKPNGTLTACGYGDYEFVISGDKLTIKDWDEGKKLVCRFKSYFEMGSGR